MTKDVKDVPYASVLVRLLQGVLYRESVSEWELLLSHESPVRAYFDMIGVTLHLDETEGFAFLRQIESEESHQGAVPRLVRRIPLSYELTLFCVLLRERLLTFEKEDHGSTRLIVGRDELQQMLKDFLPEIHDQVKLSNRVDTIVRKAEDLGFLREVGEPSRGEFEVRRVLKAKMDAETLATVRNNLERG